VLTWQMRRSALIEQCVCVCVYIYNIGRHNLTGICNVSFKLLFSLQERERASANWNERPSRLVTTFDARYALRADNVETAVVAPNDCCKINSRINFKWMCIVTLEI